MHTILGDDREQDENEAPGASKSGYLSVSFMEVYNETVFDLLAPSRVSLEVKAGKGGGKVECSLLCHVWFLNNFRK